MNVPKMTGAWKELLPDEQLVLTRCFVHYAGQPMEEHTPVRLTEGSLSGAETKIAILGLRQKGWIEAVTKTWGERMLYIPVRCFTRLYDSLLESTPLWTSAEVKITLSEACPGLEAELLHVLSRIAIQGQGIPLTAKGTIHKRTLQKLTEWTPFPSEELNGLELTYAHADLYPVQTAVLMDLLLSLGLLVKETGAFIIPESVLTSWVQLPTQEMRRHIFLTMMERYGRANAWMQHVRYVLCMASQQQNGWFSLEPALEQLSGWGLMGNLTTVSHDADRNRREAVKGWLRALAAFGMGDYGITGEEELCFQWKIPAVEMLQPEYDSVEHEHGSFYVQPDFEILVPPDVSNPVRWLLECCCERISGDRMAVYRISKDSITEAVELGMDADTIESLFEKYAKTGVPPHIQLSLSQWTKEIGRTTFAAVTLLRCRSREDADAAGSHPALNGLLERIGDCSFIVSAQELEAVRKILSSMGLAPSKGLEGAVDAEPRLPLVHVLPPKDEENFSSAETRDRAAVFSEEGRPGLVYTGRTLHFYAREEEIPEPESYFPELSSIPVTWTREWRSYHASTARQLMEQAVRWQAGVGLRTATGDRKWIPDLIQAGEPWSVKGRFVDDQEPSDYVGTASQPIVLKPEDWKEMRLILPFLNV